MWPIFDNFSSFMENVEGVNHKLSGVSLDASRYLGSNKKRYSVGEPEDIKNSIYYFSKSYEIAENNDRHIIDPCWGFAGSKEENVIKIKSYVEKNRNWIDMKYDLCGVPLKERWNFTWKRNKEKEEKLLDLIKTFSKKKYGTEKYSIIHNYSKNKKIELKNVIEFIPIPGFEIYDWIKVLENAEEIACVDSSLCNFVEVVPSLREKKKYYLGTEEEHYSNFMRNILLNNWNNIDGKKIVSDYEGKI